ncbi:MAG: Ig domain-containing protein, partial [Mariprofundaceae bacterium]
MKNFMWKSLLLVMLASLISCGDAPVSRVNEGLSVQPADFTLTLNVDSQGKCTVPFRDLDIQIRGGVPPYRIFSGSLPVMVGFSEATRANSGDIFTYTVKCPPDIIGFTDMIISDSVGNSVTHTFTLDINLLPAPPVAGGGATPPVFLNTTLKAATQFVTYTEILETTGGTGGYTYSIELGQLPNGLTLDSTGYLHGFPSVAGDYTFALRVTDSAGNFARQTFNITIAAAPVTAPTPPAVIAPVAITTAALPDATNGQVYSTNLTATGGNGTYSWSIAGGVLPTGLSLSPSTGIVTGTPNDIGGTYMVTLQASSSGATPAIASITVNLLSNLGGGGGGATPAPTSTPTQIALGTDMVSVKSDNSNFATITATVLDANNAAVVNAVVDFTSTPVPPGTSGGQLSAAVATTDASGNAVITFKAGLLDKTNGTVNITATIQGTATTITLPIQIAGSTVTLASSNTNLTNDVGGTTDTLTVTVRDAGSQPIFNTPVTLSAVGLNFTPAGPWFTDVNGQLAVTVDAAGAAAPNLALILTASATGVSATQSYAVTAPGSSFGIIAVREVTNVNPLALPYSVSADAVAGAPIDDGINIDVQVPAGLGIQSLTLATTQGTIYSGNCTAPGAAVVAAINVAPAITLTYCLASTSAAQANFQVDAYTGVGATGVLVGQDTLTVTVFQPVASAANITVQSNVNVVPPSLGGVQNIATITATVTDAGGQPVGNAPVQFRLPDNSGTGGGSPTGGGESISPVVVLSNGSGQAQATFTTGSLSSNAQGVDIQADVVGT